MIIIIEGPDGSGKSTLAKRLSDQTGMPIKHRSKPKSEKEKIEMFNSYIEDIKSGKDLIMDRCWYSEMVYGEVMRDQTYITKEQMWEMETLMLKTSGGFVIHATDTTENLWDRANERGEEYITNIYTLNEIKGGYERLFHDVPHMIPVVRYVLSKNV